MGRLEGKFAAVTGAGQGIGRAVAQRLASEGARVAAMDIDAAALAETASLIGDACLPIELDITDDEALKAAAERVESEFGALHFLHANAGISARTLASDCAPETWDKVLAVNLTGTYRTIQTFLPLMRADRRPPCDRRHGVGSGVAGNGLDRRLRRFQGGRHRDGPRVRS